MKSYECPFCHEKTITLWNKATVGSLSSKGKACPNCAGRYVNDTSSTIFRSIMWMAVLVYACIVLLGQRGDLLFQYGSTLALIVIAKLLIMGFDVFFSKLTQSLYK